MRPQIREGAWSAGGGSRKAKAAAYVLVLVVGILNIGLSIVFSIAWYKPTVPWRAFGAMAGLVGATNQFMWWVADRVNDEVRYPYWRDHRRHKTTKLVILMSANSASVWIGCEKACLSVALGLGVGVRMVAF